MSRPRILYITYGALLRQSGFGHQCRAEVRELARHGYDVTLLAFENYRTVRSDPAGVEALMQFGRWHGVAVQLRRTFAEYRPLLRPLRAALDHRIIEAEARRCRADILHAHGAYAAWMASRAARRLGCAAIADLHGVALHEYLYAGGRESDPTYRWLSRCERRAVCDSDAVFVVSGPFRDYLIETYPVPAERVTITRSSVDVLTFRFDPTARETLRNRLGAKDRPVLLFIGSIEKYQVFGEVIAFVKAVRVVEPRALFVVLTTNPAVTQAELTRHGLTEGVHVLNVPHDAVSGWISASDAGILLREPSMVNRAASPVKLAEYLACGLPVILSEGVGDLSAFVREHGLGVVIDRLEPEAYRQAAEAFLTGWPEGHEDIRAHCRRFAVEELSWDHCLEVFEGAYRRVLSPKPR